MDTLSNLTSQCEFGAPDGRPLHAYDCSPSSFSELEESLRSRVTAYHPDQRIAAGFVFWASEHIRANFDGGPLTWEFVFSAIGWPEDQAIGRDLTAQGLKWWRRSTRVSEAGIRMFLYSLMAEGGIPEALLGSQGLYRDVVLGLLREIEREGGMAAQSWSHDIAMRWVQRLPQTFSTPDVGRLLAELTLALVALRAELPVDLPEEASVRWLDQHIPGWLERIPLRMTPSIAESLIHPALRAERDSLDGSFGDLCKRELRLGEEGDWQGYLGLHDKGWLPSALFPDAEGLRLRLMPVGANPMSGVTYIGTPQEGGWQVRRFGSLGAMSFPFPPQEPFALTAFADGRTKGESVVDPGLPLPDESPTFWRASDPGEGSSASRLIPVAGVKRTRAACFWVWAPEGVDPEIEGDLVLEDLDKAPVGYLWRVSGRGTLRLGQKIFRVECAADGEGISVRLIAAGETLPGWRLAGKTPIFRGQVAFYGQRGASRFFQIPRRELHQVPSRRLFGEVTEWVHRDETLASYSLVRLPGAARLDLREIAPRSATLEVDGLGPVQRITFRAGGESVSGDLIGGSAQLKLEVKDSLPGVVEVRLSDPATGSELCLQTPWPARRGVILGPDDQQLDQHHSLSVESLYGWRAIVPPGRDGELQLRLQGHRDISLPVASESALVAHRPLIQAMLAQGGPDAQVNLSLVVGGEESQRLELRRYHKSAVAKDGELRAGLDWDQPVARKTSLESEIRKSQTLTVHAVNLSEPEQCKREETSGIVDLAQLLGKTGGPWLIQMRLEGQIQRPVVWGSSSSDTRKDRVEHYEAEWRRLLDDCQDNSWERLGALIAAVREGGDAGALDEVQALARVPAAALSLAMRSPRTSLWEIQDLEAAAPIFWPTVQVTEFEVAVRSDQTRLLAKLSSFCDAEEAMETADHALLRRIDQILILMPELASHFGGALAQAGIFNRALRFPGLFHLLQPVILPNPMERLLEVAQQAARRFDHLPAGVRGLDLEKRHPGLQFNRYAQAVIDAPLVAAEMAAQQRPEPNLEERLMLINLRAVDPIYFNEALPAALAILMAESHV